MAKRKKSSDDKAADTIIEPVGDCPLRDLANQAAGARWVKLKVFDDLDAFTTKIPGVMVAKALIETCVASMDADMLKELLKEAARRGYRINDYEYTGIELHNDELVMVLRKREEN